MNALRHEQKHYGVKHATGCTFEDKARCNPQRIHASQQLSDVDTKDAQRDEKQYDEGEQQQYLIKCPESYPNVTHTSRQESPFLVNA